jgi:hypothetical protein
MKIALEAARAQTYETSRVCDLENNNQRVLEFKPPADCRFTQVGRHRFFIIPHRLGRGRRRRCQHDPLRLHPARE